MARVVFAISVKPGLNERQAHAVADALSVRRKNAARSATRKIRDQARVNVDVGETSKDVQLDPQELAELAAVMTEVVWPDDEPEYAYLRRQVRLQGGF